MKVLGVLRGLVIDILGWNRVLVAAVAAPVTAQLMKFLIYLWSRRRAKFERLVGAGGMPSSHAALVTALVTGVGYRAGSQSTLFAVATVYALIVMYDAMSLRRTVGRQSRYLNQVIRSDTLSDVDSDEFPEFVGHTPLEVVVGAVWGWIVATLLY